MALAKEYMSAVRRIAPNWERAFWRFESEELRFGSNASYETPEGVFLVDPMKERALLKTLNSLGRRIWECEPDANKRFSVCLLRADKSFDYEIKFEREDISRWRITKLDGKTGIPEGL